MGETHYLPGYDSRVEGLQGPVELDRSQDDVDLGWEQNFVLQKVVDFLEEDLHLQNRMVEETQVEDFFVEHEILQLEDETPAEPVAREKRVEVAKVVVDSLEKEETQD